MDITRHVGRGRLADFVRCDAVFLPRVTPLWLSRLFTSSACPSQYVAIAGSGLGRRGAAFSAASGFIGTLTDAAGVAAPALSSDYFVAVLGSSWVEFENDEGRTQYYATASNGKQLYAMRNDVLLKCVARPVVVRCRLTLVNRSTASPGASSPRRPGRPNRQGCLSSPAPRPPKSLVSRIVWPLLPTSPANRSVFHPSYFGVPSAPRYPPRRASCAHGVRYDSELAAIAQDFASDEVLFLGELAAAWTKLVNLDRFDGSTGSVCA